MVTIQFILKRIIDLVIALLLFIPALFFSIPIYILIKRGSRGPIFFKQKRLGKNDRIFTMFKFRTMYQDASQKRRDLHSKNEADGFLFKMKRDPRETTFGRRLRNTGLDELPQIINVLKGEMSLVGPRPLPIEDVNLEELKQKPALLHQWQVRKSVRPGITGLWQISLDNHSFIKMLKWDEQYVENFSLFLDLKIISQTFLLAARGLGINRFKKNSSKKDQKEIPLRSIQN